MDSISSLEYATGLLGPLSLKNEKGLWDLGKSKRLRPAKPLVGWPEINVMVCLSTGEDSEVIDLPTQSWESHVAEK